ncbi:MAG: cysteine dioxygenase family protein, partial [Nostoc sp.]
IRMLVRRLIVNSYWVGSQYLEPSPKTGTSVLLLYEELGFPLTVQTVTFAPGTRSTIHNHGTWGIVAVLKGQEKNTFWQRTHSPDFQDKI